jgi:hydrogenase maturation protease
VRTVVIGCGNLDRGDDAAGLLVAARLRESGIPAIDHRGDLLALLDSWEGAFRAIIVDTVVTGAVPGSISVWDAHTAPLASDSFRGSTHAFGVAEAVRMGRALDRLPPSLWIFGIEGAQFEPGTGPSLAVAQAVEEVVKRILCMKLR